MQLKRYTWTNPSTAVAKNISVGFTPTKVEIWDLTTPAKYEWTADMDDASVFNPSTPALTSTNGVTPLSQDVRFGPSISAFTNANPGVITVDDVSTFGIVAGDTIKVTGIADDGSATTLNGTYTVASVTATTITTETNTTAYSTWVSGGYVIRVSDSDGTPIPVENKAIEGVTLGTSAVGANSADMVALFYCDENVI